MSKMTARPFAALAGLAARLEAERAPAWPEPGWHHDSPDGVWLAPTGPLGGQPVSTTGPPPGHPDAIDPATATRV